MNNVTIIFPHQLFRENPAVAPNRTVFLIEEHLFFRQYRFHQQKIAFHRASMKFYQSFLEQSGRKVTYIDAHKDLADIRRLIPYLHKNGIRELHFIDPCDDWLKKRIVRSAKDCNLKLSEYESPMFLNTSRELRVFFDTHKRLNQTEFYIRQRKIRNILLDEARKPLGGKWTFDVDNRKKYPKNKTAPQVDFPDSNRFHKEAIAYTKRQFGDNPGVCDSSFTYPVTFDQSTAWLKQFLADRFSEFGPFEDAMVREEHILNHSVLSPLLNNGLLTPHDVLDKTLEFYEQNTVPLNSCEGFIRQLIGWREFIRGVYLFKGREQRTQNFWNFTRKIPASFYEGTGGIEPLDTVIHKVLKTGYCHHIERLMVLGNFMLLCEIDPDEVYRWFMELFIDAYDWVMVPNVYGMSQFADGGLMATKPYISSSNYILKMSNFKKGDWQAVWDGLFWRFMHVHRDFFLQNPRLGMLIRTFDKMSKEKQRSHLKSAENFLNK
jgi:deoxyribodipyrimidine photolyase-related protein